MCVSVFPRQCDVMFWKVNVVCVMSSHILMFQNKHAFEEFVAHVRIHCSVWYVCMSPSPSSLIPFPPSPLSAAAKMLLFRLLKVLDGGSEAAGGWLSFIFSIFLGRSQRRSLDRIFTPIR